MDQITPKGARTMSDTEAHAAWMKENTVTLSLRFQKRTDSDILQFLDGKPRQATIKAALREYIQNHENRPE